MGERITVVGKRQCSGCEGTGVREATEHSFTCDNCDVDIDMNVDGGRLDTTVFHDDGEAERYYYCSWRCVFKHLPTLETDYFIALPYLNYNNSRSKEFFKYLKKPLDKQN